MFEILPLSISRNQRAQTYWFNNKRANSGAELSSIMGKMLNSLGNALCKDYQTTNWKKSLW